MDTRSHLDIDINVLMDTSQDFEQSQDGVRWVASQSPIPVLQALMKEAEREKRSRRSTPVHEPTSWTYPLASTAASPSPSSWHPSANSSADASYLHPLSGSTSSLAFRASGSSIPRRAKPISAGQRKPLASSTSSANQPLRGTARSRSSSHSTALSLPFTSNTKDVQGKADVAFLELLKDVSRQVDKNSEKKQLLVARTRVKEREWSLGTSVLDNRAGSGTSARPLTKTSSASAICPTGPPARAVELTTSASLPTSKPELCTLGKTASLGGVEPVSGKFTPTSLPNHDLNRDSKLAPAHPATARKVSTSTPTSHDVDTTMIDLTDTEWEQPKSHRTDTIMSIRMGDDDDASDSEMDLSFYQPEPAPQSRVPPPKPKPQPQPPQLCPTPIPRARGPPPLGMRRAPQPQPSQYNMSQVPKGTVPRFKPPLLANHTLGGQPATTTSTKPASRSAPTKAATPAPAIQKNQDPDSSFDMSFGVDADALEEAMKAYD